ncbi:MAG: AAA family ATPase, partial [Oscillospiraceae bacterium]|nr:AAA family ATPase [Oscillospiraceae bacterium]
MSSGLSVFSDPADGDDAFSETFNLPNPFLVMATQNPIEQEGTYP